MKGYQLPEILRLSLQELCLTAKSLTQSQSTGSIELFFQHLPEPPSPFNVKTAIESLKDLGALTQDERLTSLGYRLCKFPVDPNMAKVYIIHC